MEQLSGKTNLLFLFHVEQNIMCENMSLFTFDKGYRI